MDEIKMEREIKEMLHQCADELHVPDSMQARVKFALNNAPARKRHLWSKRFVAVAAVAAIAVTGAFAAGGMGGIFSQGWSDQRLDLSSTQAHLADAGVALTLPDKIGEYTFSYGSDVDTTARNDMGETEKVSEVDATYTKDGAELNLSGQELHRVHRGRDGESGSGNDCRGKRCYADLSRCALPLRTGRLREVRRGKAAGEERRTRYQLLWLRRGGG
ncbi:MAG: hypothetical protein ACLTGV_10600 [Butyricicoccus sp.]